MTRRRWPQLARRSMRKKITVLEQPFTGHFTGHHAFLLGTMLSRVDAGGVVAGPEVVEAGGGVR